MAKTTLILGAGLGKEYGFPTGPELRQMIIHKLPDHEHKLKHIFQWATSETVDEIAAKHPEHAHTIRSLVTKILFDGENLAKLQQNERPNTYKLMLKQIAISLANKHEVEVLTFNYDRSLQCLLHEVNKTEPKNRIPQETIKTVYGRLSPLFHEDTSKSRERHYHDYGSGSRARVHNPNSSLSAKAEEEIRIQQNQMSLELTSSIRFIEEEGLVTDHEISKILNTSDQIYFLGIGYHDPNMKILGIDLSIKYPDKIIAGTGYGLSQYEINYLLKKYPAIDHIELCDAHTFLKTKFSISDPDRNLIKINTPRR